MHAGAPYDPVKAHEYYLKTRQLKGRKKGSAKPPPTGGGKPKATSFTVTSPNGIVKLTPKQFAEQKAYAEARVASIAGKLHKLEAVLHEKMRAAKQSEAKSKKSAADAAKPPTAAEKAKAAKASAQYKDKHKTQLAAKAKQAAAKAPKSSPKKSHDLNTVEGLKSAINDVKKSLHAAIERQRSLASATKNTG
jgi:hypothetical protein